MARNYAKSKARRESGSFIALPHHILESQEYARLSASAVKLLVDLFSHFKGGNNGDLCCAWKLMRERGWKSRDTLFRAQQELESAGFIERTRRGRKGTPNSPNLFAVSWRPINECLDSNGRHKLDVPPTKVPSNKWKLNSDTRQPCNSYTPAVLPMRKSYAN